MSPEEVGVNLRKVQRRNTLIGKVIGGDSYRGKNTPARESVKTAQADSPVGLRPRDISYLIR